MAESEQGLLGKREDLSLATQHPWEKAECGGR